MSKQKKGLNRNVIDKFYTKPEIANLCIKNLLKLNLIDKTKDYIIEPSAGNGSFISYIKNICNNYIFYDIKPENKLIECQDFLNYDYSKCNNYKKIHIIGNPPFGRQSSLAIKFIKKCCLFANTISFILPKSFKKDSMKKYFALNYHLRLTIDIPNNSFLVNNIEYNVPCIFQVWEYKKNERIIKKKLKPINFIFVKKTEHPDISFRRVGVYAGKIMKETNDKSSQSHYFIKFTNDKTIGENLNKLTNIYFDNDNTVGPKSISKQELIFEFNRVLK
jgi:hypothetical protein